MKSKLILFSTGFVQVFFVAVNTYFLAKENYPGVLAASFMISLIWSFNVKKVAFGSLIDRLSYATGAAAGSVFGLFSSSFLSEIIKTIN